MSIRCIVASFTERLVDSLVSVLGLAVLSPLFLVVSVLIKADSPGTVFYRAPRVGRYGELFHLYKFRTMVAGAAKKGPGITTSGDNRVTRIERLLRRFKIDELPQLINIVRGEMSLVGPRPEDPRYVALYTPEQRRVLEVRPGITSPASIHYRHEEEMLAGSNWEADYVEKVLPHKLEIELTYLTRRTLWTDLGILAQTGLVLLR
jgi:lipopolysaccharide/colanic/teichoic acid biosynthesis glycosyltransferase